MIIEKKAIKYTCNYGIIELTTPFFGEKELNNDILNYKIINIKIYSGMQDNHKVITGIEYKLRNIYTGETIVKTHKNDENIIDFKELKINQGEYLSEFHIRFSNINDYITQLGFSTNKNNGILIGEEEGEKKVVHMNDGKNIILEIHGYIGNNLASIGCAYISSQIYLGYNLFKFFLLRHLLKNNEIFKKKWDESYENLPIEYKFIWRTINMPDNIFSIILSNCL